jgi:cytochrome P450
LVTRVTQRELGGRSAFGRYMQAARELDRLLRAQIAERRRAPGESLLDLILASVDAQGEPLDDAVIVQELRSLLIGGHETTSKTLAWALYFLHRDPALLERLRTEIDAIDPPVALAKAPLLGAVIDETTRIRPVAGQAFRRLLEPMELGSWQLPAGIIVSPAICLVHLREDLWPEPERFVPDRFLANPHPRPGTFIPFGGGSHRCIGANLARFESAVILGTALREHEFELADPHPPAWIRDGLPLGPAGGVAMRSLGPRLGRRS